MKTITGRCEPALCSLHSQHAAALRVDRGSQPTLPGPKMHRTRPTCGSYMIHRRGMKKSTPRRQRMPNNLEAEAVFLLDRSEEEIQALDVHPAVRLAREQIR